MGRAIGLLAIASLVGCATPVRDVSQQRFAGWMKFRGEVMLFDTRENYLDSVTRRGWCNSSGECESRIRCISGVLAGKYRDLRSWDGQRVIVTGQIVAYGTLPDDGEPILPTKVLAGKIVPNFCLRDEVILITDIRRA